ncbi:sulfurtransferase-like selenium metabolism protein YedF [Dolosigranulum pigrum]|uniref:sulfurtransferase-like selenium metabolism protein YedF n=1 Tax=Dolosigranulum pigrum TaxID=29394 RepID=UPI000DC218FD|nr:sulfurtransferase-like selenium metabolism protein YedF [Dolosigranulum pigrum]QTJ53985.1 sulfurtransferase-like selenium metabolism protein YedF [Dolosigranulum pigrum]RAN51039.1 hypothetical protein B8A31_07200 [Dolosigranulum pigrum]
MTDLTKDAYVVVISSDMMGDGEREIGEKLMTSFTYALSGQDQFPTHVLFYNSGVHVSAGESKAREDLVKLQEAGVKIQSCGTCLDYYGYDKANLPVGEATNMYEIVRIMRSASRVVKP